MSFPAPLMIEIFRSSQRGHVDYGWLDTRHSFSFGDWYEPARMGFHALRVINEDAIAPGQGFGKHFHDDMEIITYVHEGELTHKDNAGGGGVLRPGDVQHMSAGRGIIHSEFNASRNETVRLLQIWIIPKEFGIEPSYAQKAFPEASKRGALRLVASGDGRDGSLVIAQDADVFASILPSGTAVRHDFGEGRHGWVQLIRGRLDVNGGRLEAGDGAAVDGEKTLMLTAVEDAEFLLFDLP